MSPVQVPEWVLDVLGAVATAWTLVRFIRVKVNVRVRRLTPEEQESPSPPPPVEGPKLTYTKFDRGKPVQFGVRSGAPK